MATQITELKVENLRPRKENPRTFFEEAKIKELAGSIKVDGIIEPLIVRARPDGAKGQYEIIAGERRWRASKRAGLATVPCVVKDVDDLGADRLMLQENSNREDLTDYEEASGFQLMIERHGMTPKEVAKFIGKSLEYVERRLPLLSLHPDIISLLMAPKQSRLPVSFAMLAAGIADHDLQLAFMRETWGRQEDGKRDPMGLLEAQHHRDEYYQVPLTRADFELSDPELYPEMGACTTCPFNTTNKASSLVTAAEVCTKPSCFREKQDRTFIQLSARADELGFKVLADDTTGTVFNRYGDGDLNYNSEFADVDSRCYDDPKKKNRSWRRVLGKSLPTLYLARNKHFRIYWLAKRGELRKQLAELERQQIALIRKDDPDFMTEGERAALDRKRQQKLQRERVKLNHATAAVTLSEVLVKVEFEPVEQVLAPALDTVFVVLRGYEWEETFAKVLKRRGHELPQATEMQSFEARRALVEHFMTTALPGLSDSAKLALALDVMISKTACEPHTTQPYGKPLVTAASLFHVDLKEVEARQKQLLNPPKEKKAKAKPEQPAGGRRKKTGDAPEVSGAGTAHEAAAPEAAGGEAGLRMAGVEEVRELVYEEIEHVSFE